MAEHPALKQGEQTQITDLVKNIADRTKEYICSHGKFEGIHPNIIAAYFTSGYIRKGLIELDKNTVSKSSVFRNRTLNQVLEQGYFPSCSDTGLIFRGLMIAQGIPTLYLEAFHEDYILRDGKEINGHVFGRVFYDDKSTIFDPSSQDRFNSEQGLFSKRRYVIIGEGLDSWDLGIRSLEDIEKARESNFREISRKYKQLLVNDCLLKSKKISELV